MTTATLQPSSAGTRDEEAAALIRKHHAHLVTDLQRLVTAVASAADGDAVRGAKAELSTWLHDELAPHAAGEERTFYRAAGSIPDGRLLIDAMVSEHHVILGLVEQVDVTDDQSAVAAYADSVLRVFRNHAGLENDLILPLLVSDPATNLRELLEEMHEH